jgi:putative ABC transport system permease protein
LARYFISKSRNNEFYEAMKQPPRLADRFLEWFVAPHLREDIQGDLHEEFSNQVRLVGEQKARWHYWWEVLGFFKPRYIKRKPADYPSTILFSHDMIRNYFKIAFRNLIKNKGYSAINIGGLAVGMSVAMLIGLWVFDELSFNRSHQNYDRIGQVWQFVSFDVEKAPYNVSPVPLADELRTKYPDFQAVSLSKSESFVLASGEKRFAKTGNSVQPDFVGMMSVNILSGSRGGLKEMNSIMLSRSLADAFFDSDDAVNKLIKIDNKQTVRVTGVYEDFPANSSFNNVSFLTPWDFTVAKEEWIRNAASDWDNNSFQVYAQLREGADFGMVSAKIKDLRMKRDNPPAYKPEFFLHPMSRWRLYSNFKNGVNTGGMIQFVRLFGIIGIFVLFLACINFMNLSTARSEKRAKEVGIRKAVGSLRSQLISQFFSESLLVVFISFILSMLLAAMMLPFFNEVADKKITMPWSNPLFWLVGFVFSLFTGIVAGSYPALYLSSFQPLKVLKGKFSVGRFADMPRKVLVVAQFTVSVTLIVGTIIVFRQIQFAKNLPIGYDRNGLIEIPMNTPELYGHYNALRNDLLNSGGAIEMSQSSGAITIQDGGSTDILWEGKAPQSSPLVMSNRVTHDYGKTIDWKLMQGRDFVRGFSTDSASVILNQSALKLMALKKPLESFITISGKKYKVIGIIKDIVKENPFSPVNPSFFTLSYQNVNTINIRLSPELGTSDALAKVESVFRQYNPGSPFTYQFVDQEYAKKFGTEVRIGKLATFFAVLAIFISCLGLFGLASFVAEQRTKEIGIRKVLGASIVNVWQMLSRDFVVLVIISCVISTPIAWYYMNGWLSSYKFHQEISWWIFAGTGLGALIVTLLTVSYQAIRAALLDPVKSLRSE